MITDVDTCLKDIADWYVKYRREMTEPELETILMKHCGTEAEVQKFARFLETEPGQLRFKTLLREKKGSSNQGLEMDEVYQDIREKLRATGQIYLPELDMPLSITKGLFSMLDSKRKELAKARKVPEIQYDFEDLLFELLRS